MYPTGRAVSDTEIVLDADLGGQWPILIRCISLAPHQLIKFWVFDHISLVLLLFSFCVVWRDIEGTC